MTNKETIIAIQRLLFPNLPTEWDGRPGPKWNRALKALQTEPSPVLTPETPQTGAGEAPEGAVDPRSEIAIATLHKKVQRLARKVVQLAAQAGITIKITSALRTYTEQDALYAQGRTKSGPIVTNARGGYSSHQFGTAFDFTVFNGATPVWDGPQYLAVAKLGEGIGLSAGARWSHPDEPHLYLKPPFAANMSESEMMTELRRRHDNYIDAFA